MFILLVLLFGTYIALGKFVGHVRFEELSHARVTLLAVDCDVNIGIGAAIPHVTGEHVYLVLLHCKSQLR